MCLATWTTHEEKLLQMKENSADKGMWIISVE
jgi:hypothetical protein